MSTKFYQNIRAFNWLSSIFGLTKPFPDKFGISRRIKLTNKLWSVLIVVLLSLSYALSVKNNNFSVKSNLYWLCQTNDILVSTTSVLINLVEGEEMCINLYETINIILTNLKVSNQSLKLFCLKFHLWMVIPSIMYLACLILEILTIDPPFYQLVTRIPLIMSITHFLIHHWVLVAAMNTVNRKMSKKFTAKLNNVKSEYPTSKTGKRGILKYLLNPKLKFIEVEAHEDIDLKLICRIYDDLCTCMKLLEMHHGYQGLLTLWLLFSSSVSIATLLICKQAEHPLVLALIGILPYYLCFLCAHADNLMRCEVELLENLIVKFLIDFRCDQPRKNVLQVLKQQVTSNRLQFVICGVFYINYSAIQGTVMNVITYTIILVQMFLRTD